MKVRSKAAIYGITALAAAGALVLLGTGVGVFPPTSSEFNPNAHGFLSILLTDPPSVPQGVTGVFVTYTNLAVHLAGLGEGGWVATGAQGTVDTMGLVNFSQIISAGSVPSGSYNMVRFTLSSVKVEYLGKNYSATVSIGKLTVPVVGGLKVNSSSSSAAVVDIFPTVLNVGTESTPDFVVAAGAKAIQMPSGDVTPALRNVGFRLSMAHRHWFQMFLARHSDNLTVTSDTLTQSSLNLSISNPTSDDVVVTMIVVSQGSAGPFPMQALGRISGSAVFIAGASCTLQPFSMAGMMGSGMGRVNAILQGAGCVIPAGSQKTLTYSGGAILTSPGVVSGSSYHVLIMGRHLLAAVAVVAS